MVLGVPCLPSLYKRCALQWALMLPIRASQTLLSTQIHLGILLKDRF